MDAYFETEFERPYAPFMAAGVRPFYRNSAGSTGAINGTRGVTRNSAASFRSPFLSPASRTSSLWAPPTHAYPSVHAVRGSPQPGTPVGQIPLAKQKPPLPSTLLIQKIDTSEKPWLAVPDRRAKTSWWITFLLFWVGAGIAGVICWRGWVSAGESMIPDSQLCFVMQDDFDSLDVGGGGTWTRDVELGGFGSVSCFIFYFLLVVVTKPWQKWGIPDDDSVE